MHPKFQNLLCCPKTQETLRVKPSEIRPNGMIVSGELVSQSGRCYPIVRCIPRFVEVEQYAASFGYEWARWPRVQFETENMGRPMAGHTTRMWETITQVSEDKELGKTIIEFGCGSGRFLDVIRRKGGQAVGIDLSQAVEMARLNFADDPDVLIVQGDLLSSPFRSGVFHGGYTIGVLHHTPDPLRGLTELTRTVRSGGWVACSVYPEKGFYAYPSVARFRRLHNRLKSIFGYNPALAYAYFSSYVLAPLITRGKRIPRLNHWLEYVERNWLVVLNLPDIRWRLLDTFDAITPSIATTHTGDEVRGWMEKVGCTNLKKTGWGETSVMGTKV